jgi:hypothetical protein
MKTERASLLDHIIPEQLFVFHPAAVAATAAAATAARDSETTTTK